MLSDSNNFFLITNSIKVGYCRSAFSYLSILFLSWLSLNAQTKKIEFPSVDGLIITSDWYNVSEDAETILLCHQAGWSRGEYYETAIWLNSLGYNCVAIDQRSGEGVNEIVNETARRAKTEKKDQNFLDAEQDICAAIDFVRGKTGKDVILVGSSYSASLALKISAEHGGILAVAAFSPGEYFGKAMNLATKIKDLSIPTFVTCSPSEVAKTKILVGKIVGVQPTFFVPSKEGEHGSRALWTSKNGHEAYRLAFKAWLNSVAN